jgi:protein gp37
MNKTKIEWADRTWNPVTGCLHNCPYCYAEKITKRFGKRGDGTLHVLDEPELITSTKEINGATEPLEVYGEYRVCPYPFGFAPTFHRYKLERPQTVKQPQNVFVCSMADLFGDWVSDEWIEEVFAACKRAYWHRYLFLTKNPQRYIDLAEKDKLPLTDNFWYGSTITNPTTKYFFAEKHNAFLSIEPLQKDFGRGFILSDWVIVGSDTGNRKGKIIPKREWVEHIVKECREQKVPVFMKNSLASIWGEPLIREYPWSGLSA